MDRVRFGRALGGGAREAARALLRAADAAAAPNPSAQSPAAASEKPAPPRTPAPQFIPPAPARARAAAANLKHGSRRFGEAVWAPLARHSGVLWLEFTGVFFGLFALSAAIGLWQHRDEFLAGGFIHRRLWLGVLMFAVFFYFTVSSFVRAARRGRR